MSFASPFLDHAARHPDKPAVWIGPEPVSYGALGAAAQQIAGIVAAMAASAGRPPRLGLLLGNGPAFLEIFLGTVLAGGVAVILDPHWNGTRIDDVLRTIPLDLLFAIPARLAGRTLPPGTAPVPVEEDAVGGRCGACRAWMEAQPVRRGAGPVAAGTPFLIGFTSGTTGRPKAFIRDQGSWCASLEASREEFCVRAEDRILVAGPLVHGLSLYGAVEGLTSGATVHLLPKFEAAAAAERLLAHRATALVAVPTMLVALVEEAARRSLRFDALERIVSAGAKLSPALRDRLAAVAPAGVVYEYYGASELSFVSVASSREACPPDSVGRPFRGVELSLRRGDGQPAAPGEVGWVHVRSAMLSAGYLGETDGTGFRIADGWATVGDRGRLDADGFLHLVGREGDMLISGGLNVYPAEVEAALAAIPEIETAIVFGVADDYWGDVVCAALRWRGQARLSAGALRARCRDRLDARKCPRRFFVVSEMPLTASGKIAGSVVRERVLSGHDGVTELP